MCYSTEELNYIDENLGKIPLETIANRIGRSPKSLEITLIRKKGTSNTKIHTGMITAGELATILKVDRNTVIGWIDRHGLPSKKRVTRYQKTFTFIDIEKFWKWAEVHREKIDFSKIVPNSLPPEPEFVKEERNKKKKIRNYKMWTVLEEKKLMKLALSGMCFKEIAFKLDRTQHSVEKKYYRLMDSYFE